MILVKVWCNLKSTHLTGLFFGFGSEQNLQKDSALPTKTNLGSWVASPHPPTYGRQVRQPKRPPAHHPGTCAGHHCHPSRGAAGTHTSSAQGRSPKWGTWHRCKSCEDQGRDGMLRHSKWFEKRSICWATCDRLIGHHPGFTKSWVSRTHPVWKGCTSQGHPGHANSQFVWGMTWWHP